MDKFSNIKKPKNKVKSKNKENIFKTNENKNIYENEGSLEITEVGKFFSKILESREMAHVYHLQVKGEDGSFSKHKALEDYYNDIIDIVDDLIETYQGQYDIVENYDIIDSSEKTKDPIEYFKDLGDYISNEKKCIDEKDTHLHSLVDDISCTIYKTLYKLRFNK